MGTRNTSSRQADHTSGHIGGAKLRATQENKGKGRQGAMTAGLIGTGILFFPVAPLFLFMHGKDVVVAKDTPVVAYVDGDTELDATKFSAVPKPSETKKPEEGPAKEKPEKPPVDGTQKPLPR